MRRQLSLVVLLLCCTAACRSAAPRPGSPVVSSERRAFLEQFARGYFAGRSGQIFLVPAEGHYIINPEQRFYQFMHGSPWSYDAHIPLLFYGPAFVRRTTSNERVSQQDIVPTLAAFLDTSPPATARGRVLHQALVPGAPRPKVIAVFVIDAGRADYFTTYAAVMPTLSRLRADGAWFDQAYVSSAPTVTAVGHANIGTGAEPSTHGIAVNYVFDAVNKKEQEAYGATLDPAELVSPTLADDWNVRTEGRAVIIGQGGAMRATIGLVGHGGCFPNAPRVIASSYATSGGWTTNTKCYVLSPALESLSAEKYWTTERTTWMGHEVADAEGFKPTALFQRFEGDALAAVLEREAVGADEVTDLVLVNLKAPDYVGHAYGPESPEMRETLRELDAQVQRAVAILERKAGKDGVVITVTADHGMPGGTERHSAKVLADAINGRFGSGTVQMLRDGANSAVHIDTSSLAAAGHTLDEVAAFLERDPSVGYIKYAFTETEVRAVLARQTR